MAMARREPIVVRASLGFAPFAALPCAGRPGGDSGEGGDGDDSDGQGSRFGRDCQKNCAARAAVRLPSFQDLAINKHRSKSGGLQTNVSRRRTVKRT